MDVLQSMNTSDKIWTWATVKVEDSKGVIGKRWRVWGYFFTKEEAVDYVENHDPSLFREGSWYDHVVIESVKPGENYDSREEIWYRLVSDTQIEPCGRPDKLKNIVHLTLG